jgi:hypothetical protein
MKKIFAIISVAMGMLSLASCVTSLQPVSTRETITTDRRVAGNWVHDGETFNITPFMESEFAKSLKGDMDAKEKISSEEDKRDSIYYSKMYAVYFQKEGVSYHMAASLTKLNGQLFMDLFPLAMNDPKEQAGKNDPLEGKDYLGGFTIAKVELNGQSGMTLKFVDGDFINEQIKTGRMRLKHESNELFGTFIITASTEELRTFLQKYANDDRVFNKQTTISLTRKPSHT